MDGHQSGCPTAGEAGLSGLKPIGVVLDSFNDLDNISFTNATGDQQLICSRVDDDDSIGRMFVTYGDVVLTHSTEY